MKRKINIRPTTSVYATYKNIKYEIWTAISEFVDNSTQSYFDNVRKLEAVKYWKGLNIEIIYEKDPKVGDRLIIKDNAYGMGYQDFTRAIMLDSPPKKRTRSEFGMGLKTAACWFGKKWSVETVELGSGKKYFTSVDVLHLQKYKDEEIEVEEIDCSTREHGTTITIWDLNRTIVGRQVKKTKDQLCGIYRADIRTGAINIFFKGEKLTFEEPKILIETLPDGSSKVWKKEVDFSIDFREEKYTVKGFIALRETASTSDAGFTLMKNGRAIIGGYENNYRPEEIFEKPNSFVYQRLFGELNMDNWSVVQTKDDFDWKNGLEDVFIDKLLEECSDYIKQAKDYRKGKKTTIDVGVTRLVESFAKAGIIENVEIQPIKIDEMPSSAQVEVDLQPQADVEKYSDKEDLIVDGDTCKKIQFDRHGKPYVFNLRLEVDDPLKQWLYISKRDGEFDIEWNIRHPFFKPYINDPAFLEVMEQFIFAFALSEIESRELSENGKIEPATIRNKMNEMLKDVIKGGKS